MILKDFQALNFPDTPGVYVFLDLEKMTEEARKSFAKGTGKTFSRQDLQFFKDAILYIGKATSLKDRVKSYFSNDLLHERGLHIGNMVTLANHIIFIATRSVLESTLLENDLIKEYYPKYNTAQKDDKSYFVLVITEEDYPRVVLVRYKDIDHENNLILKSKFLGSFKKEVLKIKKTFGPYPNGVFAKDSLKLIRRIFPFRDKCVPFDKKTPWKKNPCFSYQIGLCPGVCLGAVDKKKYNLQIERLITFLEGYGEKVRQDLENDMQTFSKKLMFEEAQKVRDTLFALDHIRDAHLIQKEENYREIRIEAYDIAHLSGKNRVGAMTVFQNGVLAKHEYKKFKISTDKNDDLEGLKELFTRRIKHIDWGIPDIVVVDGDNRHINVVENILKENNINNIKVVAVTKDKRHKAAALTGNPAVISEYKDKIILVNAEAHRFSLNFHKNLRKKSFLS